MESAVPLNYEASAGDTHKQTTTSLPQELVQCLDNARFLHFATCSDNTPHISLMNYTYLPTSPYSSGPVIVMTTNPSSKKMNNLLANPNVSLLVHDWSSHRPPSSTRRPSATGASGSPPPTSPSHPPRSSLASLLLNLNSSAISSISATINGLARLLERGCDEEKFFQEQHMENNTFEGGDAPVDFGGIGNDPAAASDPTPTINGGGNHASTAPSVQAEDGGRGCFIAGEEVRVIVVAIKDVRISDWKGGVRDWVITGGGDGDTPTNGAR